jgi:hypothetical protein
MNKEFDVCIIGSGPSGAFAAYELAMRGLDIAVIEAGDDHLNSDADNLFDCVESNVSESINFGFSQQVGGASNLWAGGLAKMDDVDLCERPEFGFSGWPVTSEELDLLYQRVDKIIEIDGACSCANKSTIHSINELITNSNLELRRMMVMNLPFRTSNLVKEIKNITLFKNNSAFKLSTNSQHDSVTCVHVHDHLSNTEVAIVAKKYMLAAGSLTNIRLLLHSFSEFKDDISELYNNIGSHFSTHPKGYVGKLKLFNPLDFNHPFISIDRSSNYTSRYQLGLSKDILLEKQMLNHCLRFDSSFTRRASRLFELSKSLLHSIPYIKNSGWTANILYKLGVIVFRYIDNVSASGTKKKGIPVRAFFDQASRQDNKITLSSKISDSGLPLAKISWEFNEDDWKNVELFIESLSKELHDYGIGELSYKRPKNDSFTGIHSHFIGGTRIGSTPANSVVDPNLKVHGFENLYISGPSVFPSFGYANPFYTIAALSIRLADNISSDLNKNKLGL